ncbi:hypothetical protein vBSauS24_120 [Staphylococcus phage vB_Sau_S24]|nr:hypothetical protein vBSauClo6_120 [Staphylococcus phage vB_Sau_Clo6]ARM69475.1 hypothetical protein vBSauS24_120 [Staphylococcus phage vB_Sau_S24]
MISRKDLINRVNNSINNPTDEEIKHGEKILKKLDKGVKEVAYRGGDLVHFPFFIRPTLGTVKYVIDRLENLGYDVQVHDGDAGHYINIYLNKG